MPDFTHLEKKGNVRMVDISEKHPTSREATAEGFVRMRPDTLASIKNSRMKKGNVLETARIAGIMAAKKTPDLIPLCHPIAITYVHIDFSVDEAFSSIGIRSTVRVIGQTGVEMEALTAVSATALTIYDMCKSYDREMVISDIRLTKKSGGKSGTFVGRKK